MNRFLLLFTTIFVITLSINSNTLFSQKNSVTIFGKVKDESNGEIIRGATIQVLGTKKGANSDVKGEFKIKGLEPGVYTFKVSYLGYQTKELAKVEVKPGANEPLTINLSPEVKQGQEVVVSAARVDDNEMAMLQKRKNAEQVSDGISSEEIKKMPDSDAGQALKRVSGVTLVGDKFVYVRGVSERYSNTTLNGASLATTEPDKKAFAFDLFPADFLENANIAKSFTPDLPGNFAGGLVQLNTVDFPAARKIKMSLTTSGSTNLTLQDKFLSSVGGTTDYLGLDDGTRALPNVDGLSRKDFDQLRQDLKGPTQTIDDKVKLINAVNKYENILKSFNNNVWETNQQKAPMNLGMTLSYADIYEVAGNDFGLILSGIYNNGYNFNEVYRSNLTSDLFVEDERKGTTSTYSTNLGGIFNIAYKIGGTSSISLKNSFNVSSDDEVTILEGRTIGKSEDYKHYGFQYLQKTLRSSQLGGEHQINFILDNAMFDWKLGTSSSERDEPDFRRLRFARNDSSAAYVADFTNAAQAGFGYNGGRFFSNLKEDAYSAAFNFVLPVDKLKIKMGMNYETKSRDFTVRSLTYLKANTLIPNSVKTDIIIDDVPTKLDSADWFVEGTEFDAERYGSNFSQTDPSKLQTIFENNFGINGIGISEDSRDQDSYKASETVLATYLMGTMPFEIGSEKFKAIAGFRVENSNQRLGTYFGDSTVTNPIFSDVLPSFNIIYELNPETNIRASYTKTLTRPSLREYAPFTFYDFTYKMNVTGEPALKRALIQNYDLRYETYPGLGELVSVSLFYKSFENAIEEVVERTGNALKRTFKNAQGTANTYGAEFEFRKGLGFLSSDLDKFSFNTNLALIKSIVTVVRPDNSQLSYTRAMWGQSPYTVNLSLSYANQESGTQVNLGYNVYGRRIIQVSNFSDFKDENALNVYELPRNIVDFSVVQKIGDVELKFVAKDILAQDLIWNQGAEVINQNTVSRNIRGAMYSLGVSYVIK